MADRPRIAPGLRAGAANRVLGLAVGRLGLPVAGVWILRTRGRRTGRVHDVPVVPVVLDGERYLVAPRGATDWMRNLNAAGAGELRRGRTAVAVTPEPVEGGERVAVLAAYVRAHRRRIGGFFEIRSEVTAEAVTRIADRHPVVRLREPDPAGRDGEGAS